MTCRTVFVGAVEEGRRCLEAMLAWREPFAGFVTLKEEVARETSGAVPFDDLAERHAVPLLKVRDLNHRNNVERLRAMNPDLLLVIGWTRLIGPELLELPRLGCIGFHASLLPRYRGRAPVNWAIINGETETGNSMFYLDGGVDTGDLIAQRRIAIAPADTCATLYEKVAASAVEMLRENLPLLKEGRAPRIPQDHALATVMPRRRPEDGLIVWEKDPAALDRWVRALTHPYPGAFTHEGERRVFVWKAAPLRSVGGEPGEVIAMGAGGVDVATGNGGALRLESIQIEGGVEGPAVRVAEQAGWRPGLRLGAGAPAAPAGGRT